MSWWLGPGAGLWSALPLLINLAVCATAVLVIPRNRTPASGTAWLMLVFLQPIIGMLLFLAIGNNHVPRSRREKQEHVGALLRSQAPRPDLGDALSEFSPWVASVVGLVHSLGGMPLVGGNGIRLQPHYERFFDDLVADIDAAERFVHVQFYILAADDATEPVFAALERATARGVRVRVLLDFWASRMRPGFRRTRRRLEEVGAIWTFALPLHPLHGEYQRPDLRNHRKIVVIDGKIGWTGSQNLVASDYDRASARRRGMRWVDLMARVEGPVVLELETVFRADWYVERGEIIDEVDLRRMLMGRGEVIAQPVLCQVLPSGPGYDAETNLQLFLALLSRARERVAIVSPYFVPNDAMLYALRGAVARGIELDLYVSETGDHFLVHHAQCSYYEQLLDIGVRIHRYAAPNLLHTKFAWVDGEVVAIGSSNMDMRSFQLNMEVTMLVCGREPCVRFLEVERSLRGSSTRLTKEEWGRRSWPNRVLDNLCRLTSALQ